MIEKVRIFSLAFCRSGCAGRSLSGIAGPTSIGVMLICGTHIGDRGEADVALEERRGARRILGFGFIGRLLGAADILFPEQFALGGMMPLLAWEKWNL